MIHEIVTEVAQLQAVAPGHPAWMDSAAGGITVGSLLFFLGNKLVNGILTKVDTFLNRHLAANATTAENTTAIRTDTKDISTAVAKHIAMSAARRPQEPARPNGG